MKKLHVIPALNDNYIWILELANKNAVIVDPSVDDKVIQYLQQNNLNPIAILLTHHHNDHIGGVTSLKAFYPDITVYGPNEIKLPIKYIQDKETIHIADDIFKVLATPGHTLGHVCYYCEPYLFCGDTLFSAGCGRIFEGTHEQMYSSLKKIKAFPPETILCPAHEYTLTNLKFAKQLVSDDHAINNYYNQVKDKTRTLPITLEQELKINLFLRSDSKSLQSKFKQKNDLDMFIFFRTQRDNF